MSEYIITIEQIKDLVTQSAVEAIDGYKSGVVKQIWHYPLLPKIVRCGDCEHSRKDGTLCMFFASWEPISGGDEYAEMPVDVEPDGFCAWGERKAGE